GLFGGELLVLYKAITTIQLARQWSEKLGRPVVPIFWIAGEDHDFDEVNHIYTLTNKLQVDKIKIDHPTGLRSSISNLKFGMKEWEQALQTLGESLMDTEFKPAIMDKLFD